LIQAGSNKKKLLLFGGDVNEGTNPLNDSWKFHPRDNSWVNQTEVGQIPPGNKHGASAQVEEFFFVVGGFNILSDGTQVFTNALYGAINV